MKVFIYFKIIQWNEKFTVLTLFQPLKSYKIKKTHGSILRTLRDADV